MYYLSGGYSIKVSGMDKIDGKDAYKLMVTGPSGEETTEWYDAQSGYLVKSESSTTLQGQTINQTMTFSNYKKTGNIMMPYSMVLSTTTPMGEQEMPMEMKSITLNTGITKEDFK
jgi:hypothetical protein